MILKRFLSLLTIGLFVFVVGCTNGSISTTNVNTNNNDYVYSDYIYYQIENFDDQLNRLESDYYIYYYSEVCSACIAIKNDVLSTISNLEEDHLFLFDISRDIQVEPSINLRYTPTLAYISDNQYVEKYVGADDILEILDNLN
ncbi:MAG: hypothetical protein K9L64_02060 [Candidatus Izimaplasma sp.]|nr:hypothetical protein [Candidatus Izimaplasma bacterium]